jgi:hypothetical protein
MQRIGKSNKYWAFESSSKHQGVYRTEACFDFTSDLILRNILLVNSHGGMGNMDGQIGNKFEQIKVNRLAKKLFLYSCLQELTFFIC